MSEETATEELVLELPIPEDDSQPPREFFLEIGGRKRRGVVDFNAMVEIETLAKKPMLAAFGNMMKISSVEIHIIVYATLRAGNPRDREITLDNVSEWLDLSNFNAYMMTIAEAIGAKYRPEDERSLAPYVPTPNLVLHMALKLCKFKAGDTFLDLGCGTGDSLLIAGEHFQASKVIGYEINAERYSTACKRVMAAAAIENYEYKVVKEDLRDAVDDIREANTIFVYLLPSSNEAIKDMLSMYAPAGCKIVSHDFVFDWPEDWLIDTYVETSFADKQHTLYVYEIPRFEGLVN